MDCDTNIEKINKNIDKINNIFQTVFFIYFLLFILNLSLKQIGSILLYTNLLLVPCTSVIIILYNYIYYNYLEWSKLIMEELLIVFNK